MSNRDCWSMLRCPVCRTALQPDVGVARCAGGHAFDLAREGYVNLRAGRRLPPLAGDAPEMLRARRRFLAGGHYLPLSDAMNQIVLDFAQGPERGVDAPLRVLDAGSGEGFYLGFLHRTVTDLTGIPVSAVGIDISKVAARMAARSFPDALFAVADINGELPVADEAVDVLLNGFAPRNPSEFARVLAPGGLLIVALPAPDHLAELRARFGLLAMEAEKEREVVARMTGRREIRFAGRQALSLPLSLDTGALTGLLDMTPNFRHRQHQPREALGEGERVEVTASFVVLTFEIAPVAERRAAGATIPPEPQEAPA